MKFKGSTIQLLSTILTFILCLSLSEQKRQEWCWTRPFLEAKITQDAIGINYALCEGQKIKKDSKQSKEEKEAEEKGKKGPYYLTISSDTQQGEEFELNSKGFPPGQKFEIQKETFAVGEVNSIKIRQDDYDNSNFTCDKVVIKQGASEWDFPCDSILDAEKKYMNINLQDPMVKVKFEISQRPQNKFTKDFPLMISLTGQKGKTNYQLIDNFQLDGKDHTINLNYVDVGEIKCIQIKSIYETKPQKSFIVKEIKMTVEPDLDNNKDGSKQELHFKNQIKKEINPGQKQIILCDGDKLAKFKNPHITGDYENPISIGDDMVEFDPMQPADVTNFQNGLEDVDQKSMQIIDCDKKAETLFEDITLFGEAVNYEVIYVVCPPRCGEEATVTGRTVYAPETAVCAAGIVDGSIPKSGGLMGVQRLSGHDTYNDRVRSYGITVIQGAKSKWSFTTQKINNPDFSKSDVRILDQDGVPNFEGRVEFRVSGKWGTVSNEGTTHAFARQVCRVLNYKDGNVLNEGKNFCLTFVTGQQSLCGFTGQPVHYSHYDCSQNDVSLQQCSRQVPGSYQHSEDVIIRCSMIDMKDQDDLNPIENQVRLVGEKGTISDSKKGRPEIYTDNKWNAICSAGFSQKSAEVACKQMDYSSGKLIGNPDELGACSKGTDNYCAQSQQIGWTNMTCKDDDITKLSDCGGQKTEDCSSEATAVIECDGVDGVASGDNQKPRKDDHTARPVLGQLPLANPYQINCQTKVDDSFFEGDPGSIYICLCPPKCSREVGVVHGTGIYDESSPICKSATHGGIIDDEGGFVTVKIGWPHSHFKDSENQGIQSLSMNWSPRSFGCSKTLNFHKKISLELYDVPERLGLKAPFTREHHNSLEGIVDPTSFFQLQNQQLDNNMSKISRKFQNYLQKKAFLRLSTTDDLKPTFQYTSPEDFKFNDQTKLDPKVLIDKDESLSNLQSFTIFTQFKLEALQTISGKKQPAVIFGDSDQSCWSLEVNGDGKITFGKENEMHDLGYALQVNQKVHLALIYDEVTGILKTKVKTHDKTITNQSTVEKFQFQCAGGVNIGRNIAQNNYHFIGEINYIQFFPLVFRDEDIDIKFTQPIPTFLKTLDETKGNCHTTNILKSTIDGRKCVQPCTRDEFPGMEKAPPTPDESKIGQPTGAEESSDGAFIETDEQSTVDGEGNDSASSIAANADALECNDTVLTKNISGLHRVFRFYCNKGCGEEKELFLFGTQIYHELSSICKAAVHSGSIDDNKGGEFQVKIVKAPTTFTGTASNGLDSTTIQTEENPIAFTIEPALPVIDVQCDTTASDAKFGKLEGMKTIVCPKGCTHMDHKVYNNKFEYWMESSACQAAMHAGILTDLGGQVKIIYEKPLKQYPGSFNAGINGLEHSNPEQEGHSFRISGNKLETTPYFEEDYDRSHFEKAYKIIDEPKGDKETSNWEIKEFPSEDKRDVIRNDSKIEDKSKKPGIASKFIREGFETVNGIYKVNIFFEKGEKAVGIPGQTALYFRYYDKTNYYVIKFNIPERPAIEFYKMVNGEEHLLGQKTEHPMFDIWYYYYITFYENNITISRQRGQIRQLETLFEVKDDGIGRGTVGIGTNGDAKQTYFHGISCQDYTPGYGIIPERDLEHREYNECVLPTTITKREHFLKEHYHLDKVSQFQTTIIQYCSSCCSQRVMSWEEILHYDCVRQCISVNRTHEKVLRQKQGSLPEAAFKPRVDHFVDFRNQDQWTKAKITQVKQDTKDVLRSEITLEVMYIANKPQSFDIQYPSADIVKCGTHTKGDCTGW